MKKTAYISPNISVIAAQMETALLETSWSHAIDGEDKGGINGQPPGNEGGAKEFQGGLWDIEEGDDYDY